MQSLDQIIQHVRENSPDPGKCLLSFSGGKDAWGCWDVLHQHFDITPYCYYLVPGLEVVEEYLAYCETKMGTRIVRLPSPQLYRMLNNCVFQPPERVATIDAAGLPEFDWDAVSRCAEITAGLPEGCWTACGVRAADSIARSSAIKQHGAWSDKRRVFFPIWDWKKPEILACLNRNSIKLSPEYKAFGRTFDGLYLLYAWGLKKHFPRDYARCLEFFPLMDLEIFRLEKALGRYGSMDALPKAEALAAMSTPKHVAPKRSMFSFRKEAVEAPAPAAEESKFSRLNAESKRVADKAASMTETSFWISIYFPDNSRVEVVFEDRGQKDHFLRELKLAPHGDMYLDGGFVASKLGVKVPGLRWPRMERKPRTKNPLGGLAYPGKPDADSLMEMDALLHAMPAALPLAGSLAEKFLNTANLLSHANNGRLWCHDIAPALGVELPPTTYYYRPEARPDAKLNALV